MRERKLLHEELSFKLRGIFFAVHNSLGSYRNEKQYCDAIEFFLKEKRIMYEREMILSPSFSGEHNNRNRVDFIVENKIIIEVKTISGFSKNDYFQCLRYLVSCEARLVLLVNFRGPSCLIRRVLSPKLLSKE